MDGFKGGVGQADFLRVTVHQIDKRILATGDIVGDSDAGIVTGLNYHALIEVFNRYLHAWLQEHHRGATQRRVARGPRIAANGNRIGQFNFACFQRLAYHVTGHDFGQAGRVEFLVGITFTQHFAAGIVHQDPGSRIN